MGKGPVLIKEEGLCQSDQEKGRHRGLVAEPDIGQQQINKKKNKVRRQTDNNEFDALSAPGFQGVEPNPFSFLVFSFSLR